MPAAIAPETERSSARRYVLLALKIAVSAALLGLLFSKIDTGELWEGARRASVPWLLFALGVYAVTVAAGVWRWHLLLEAQHVHVGTARLTGSFLVALFFNNFLPSNVGGDVIRISDTAKEAQSKTLATTVVLTDRVLGLMGLVLVAATAASIGAKTNALPIVPVWLWVGFFFGAALSAPAVMAPAGVSRLLQPLRVFHPEWVGTRIDKLTGVLEKFRDRPGALAGCFSGAVFV